MLKLHAIDDRILFKFTSTSLTKCELMFPIHVGRMRDRSCLSESRWFHRFIRFLH